MNWRLMCGGQDSIFGPVGFLVSAKMRLGPDSSHPKMSSFKRRTPIKVSSANSSTVSEKNNLSQSLHPTANIAVESQLLSGLSSIDDILGLNGLPRGHALLFRTPDPHSAWGLMISRYALAQGLVTGDAVAVIAQEDDANDLISGCMWTSDAVDTISADTDDVDPDIEPEGGVKIAWRYSKMKQFSTTVPKRGSLGGVDQGMMDLHMSSDTRLNKPLLFLQLSCCLAIRVCYF